VDHRRGGGCRQGRGGESDSGQGGDQEAREGHGRVYEQREGKSEELRVKPFPFCKAKFMGLNGFPFAGQHTGAKGSAADAGREREDSAERNADGNAGARFVYM